MEAAGLTTTELKYQIEELIRPQIKNILFYVKLSSIPLTIYGEVNGPYQQLIVRQYPEEVKIHQVDITGIIFIETELLFKSRMILSMCPLFIEDSWVR